MRLLAHDFDVTALCFYRRATRPTQAQIAAAIEGLSPLGSVEVFPIPQEHSRARLLWDHLRSLVTGFPYTRFAHDSVDFSKRIQALLTTERFDIVHLDSLDLSAHLPAVSGIPVVCTHHNIESDLLSRRAKSETSLLRKWYMLLQARLTRYEEQRWCGRVSLNAVVSHGDASRLSQLVPGALVSVVPNGVDTATFRPSPEVQGGLVFVGGHSWYPNRDAMEYFGESILPLIRRMQPEVAMTWVGRAPEHTIARYAAQGMRLTGYVDDVRPYVHAAACYVVPLRVGGGTRLKILDAWAMGKAVVSTPIGCEGLDAIDGHNIIIRDTPEAFAQAVVEVLSDPDLRMRIGAAGRSTVETTYDWNVIGRSMIKDYRDLVGSKGSVGQISEASAPPR